MVIHIDAAGVNTLWENVLAGKFGIFQQGCPCTYDIGTKGAGHEGG